MKHNKNCSIETLKCRVEQTFTYVSISIHDAIRNNVIIDKRNKGNDLHRQIFRYFLNEIGQSEDCIFPKYCIFSNIRKIQVSDWSIAKSEKFIWILDNI